VLVAGAAVLTDVLASGTPARRTVRARPSDHPSAPRSVEIPCSAPSLEGKLPALVSLPAGYDSSARRYPVVYVLHGLPAGTREFTRNPFVSQAVASGSMPAIVVAPQGARTENSDREYLDESPTENWPRAIAHDLPRCIDARYRTIRGRDGRILLGFSAGGYGAATIGLRNLATYGAVESWSGYFEATDPSGDHVLNLGSPAANAAAAAPRGPDLARSLARHPAFIGFYVGAQDSRFLADNRAFDAALRRAHIPHTFAVYPGGHTVELWTSHAREWLGYALVALHGLNELRAPS
jgi:enterochelin esterase-like enzyme